MTDEEIFDCRMLFAGTLRKARLARGYSLSYTAHQLKCTYPMVSQFETDGLTPRSKFFWRACRLFELDPESFDYDKKMLLKWRLFHLRLDESKKGVLPDEKAKDAK